MSVMASHPPNMPAGAAGKRPRLSLQIKTSSAASSRPAASRGAFTLNPSDPTAFNTLSNAYVTAIERTSTPIATTLSPSAAEPLTAINSLQAITLSSPISLKPQGLTVANTPRGMYPETPLSAHLSSPSMLLPLPSVMSPTPPMSAGAIEGGKVFSFSPRDAAAGKRSLEQALHAAASGSTTPTTPSATPPPSKRPVRHVSGSPPPYTHAKALNSILRNSPLPSRARLTASLSPRQHRPAVRIVEGPRPAKRVCYLSPIEQEITTNTYTKSHIDLLAEEASPCSPRRLDLSRAFTPNEIQDGGQTPGPFEDASRRLGVAAGSPKVSPGGIRKSRSSSSSSSSSSSRGEKKRRWVWTIGSEENADEDEQQLGGAVVAAARAAAAAAAGESVVSSAPVLAVPTPGRMKLDTNITKKVTMSENIDMDMS